MKRFKILSLNYKFLRLSLTNNRLPDNTNSQPRFIIQFSSILCPVLCTLAKLSCVTQNNYSWSQFVSSATFFDVYNCIVAVFFAWGCLHDTGATFAPRRVHSGSLPWLYICLHDTTTKSHAGASRPGVSSLRLSHRGENFTPVRNLATVSCKHETTTRFGVKSV